MFVEWESVRLGDVCSIEARLVDPTLPEFDALPHLGIDKIVSGTGELLPLSSARDDGVTSGKFLFTRDDVIYSKIRPELKKAAFPRFTGLASADAYPLRPSDRCLPEFLVLLLLSEEFTEASVAKSGRTKMPKINRDELFSINVLLPPLRGQRRIVDLISAIDAAIAAVQREEAEAGTVYTVLRNHLFAQTSSWENRPLAEVAEVRLGRMLSKERAAGSERAPYIRNANIQWHGLDLADLKEMSFPARERETYALQAGDILVCEGGDPGRSVLLEVDLPGIYYQKAVHRVRPLDVLPGFLYEWLRECYGSGAISDLCTNTTIAHLTAEKFRTLSVPSPTADRQAEIGSLLREARVCVVALAAEVAALRQLRSGLLGGLFRRELELPDSYDAFVAEAV